MKNEREKTEGVIPAQTETTQLKVTGTHRHVLDPYESINPYYMTISKRYRFSKLMLLVVLVIFILAMISVYREEITVDNLRYLLKNLDNSYSYDEYSRDGFEYESASNAQFILYKGDIAIVRNGSFSLYETTGSTSMNILTSFYNPVGVTSDKYFLIYDIGESTYSYSLYNTFSEIYNEKYDRPITGADISDSGTYAIVSSTVDYSGAIYIYNKNNKIISRIYKEKHVTDIELSEDGSLIYILSVYDSDGFWETELMICRVNSDTPEHVIVSDDVMGLELFLTESGFCMVTDKDIRYFDQEGNLVTRIDMEGRIPIMIEHSGDCLMLTYNRNILGYERDVYAYSDTGQLLFETTVDGQIKDAEFVGDTLMILLDDSLVRIHIDDGIPVSAAIESGAQNLLLGNDDRLILCYKSKAQFCDIENLYDEIINGEN